MFDEVVLDGSKTAITYPMITEAIVKVVSNINNRFDAPVGVVLPQ